MWAMVVAAVFLGVTHSLHIYWLSIYSLHEGAAHNLIFPGKGRASRAGRFVAANLCRLAATDPEHYSRCHMAHHAKFGSEDDAEFLNFVLPRRFWLSLLPFACFFNYTDFFVHRPLRYNRSRAISAIVAALYNGLYLFMLYRLFGVWFAVIVGFLTPHVGFYLDRMRQFTEHNLMPLEKNSGARSLGVGFWGLLVGGGPWGQPCHLAHHMVASIPWYQQILLHRDIVRRMTPEQRDQFLLRPIVGFPRMLWRVLREAERFSKGAAGRALVGDLTGQ
jgi:fatty acid desaturase